MTEAKWNKTKSKFDPETGVKTEGRKMGGTNQK